jgi:hypothetical protein
VAKEHAVVKNRALLFAALGFAAGILLDEYWPALLQAIERYDAMRKGAGQDSLIQNLADFFYSALRDKRSDGVPKGPDELLASIKNTVLDDLIRYAKLKYL